VRKKKRRRRRRREKTTTEKKEEKVKEREERCARPLQYPCSDTRVSYTRSHPRFHPLALVPRVSSTRPRPASFHLGLGRNDVFTTKGV